MSKIGCNGNKIEILAPVGGKEQLLAAVRCGADAVYFGLQNFNARRNADNFSGDDLQKTIEYCHERAVRVFITINTLVKDCELADMKKAVDTACEAGADGLIIQDLAVMAYCRERWPEVPMVASTQMAVHNAEGTKLLEQLGFSRAVLARELSLNEIRDITGNTGMELECFVHGAHCMSVSGLCYLSSMIGGRSGNRGLCAQPCRLDCSVCGRDYALSLKDLSYIKHIGELAAAGVGSLKIEGRMKRPEYVAASVLACRAAIRGEAPDLDTLRSVFSRSGFTDGYLTGERSIDMFGHRTREDVTAAADVLKDLAKTYEKEPQTIPVDMYLYVKEGEPAKLRASCSAPGADSELRRPGDGVAADDVAENTGGKGRTGAALSCGEDGINADLTAGNGRINADITVGNGRISAEATGETAQKAKTMPITEEYARRSLSKTGGTPYQLRELKLFADEGLMLPASALNELRRRVLEDLGKARADSFVRHSRSVLLSFSSEQDTVNYKSSEASDGLYDAAEDERRENALWARFSGSEQLFSGCPKTVILPLEELTGGTLNDTETGTGHGESIVESIKAFGAETIIAEIPSVIWPVHMDAVRRQMQELQKINITDVYVENLGTLKLAQEFGLTAHGGMLLNILNSEALEQYRLIGLKDACMSFEMSFADMRRITSELPAGAVVYGYLPLMKFRNCPAKGKNGCGKCSGLNYLTDRKNERFPIVCHGRQYSELLNCVPLYLGDRSVPALDHEILYFTTESARECAAVTELYRAKEPFTGRKTAGLYFRDLL